MYLCEISFSVLCQAVMSCHVEIEINPKLLHRKYTILYLLKTLGLNDLQSDYGKKYLYFTNSQLFVKVACGLFVNSQSHIHI